MKQAIFTHSDVPPEGRRAACLHMTNGRRLSELAPVNARPMVLPKQVESDFAVHVLGEPE